MAGEDLSAIIKGQVDSCARVKFECACEVRGNLSDHDLHLLL